MKVYRIVVPMKTPDALDDALEEHFSHTEDDDPDASTEDSLAVREALAPFFRYGENVSLEFYVQIDETDATRVEAHVLRTGR